MTILTTSNRTALGVLVTAGTLPLSVAHDLDRLSILLEGCGPLPGSEGSAESSSSGAMSLASKRLNGGCHQHHQGRRSARVGSGRVPPRRRAASIPVLVCETLPRAVPI